MIDERIAALRDEFWPHGSSFDVFAFARALEKEILEEDRNAAAITRRATVITHGVQRLEKETIYLYQYNGYNGSYAQRRILLWRCTLIGNNGEKKFGGSWMSEGHGTAEKHYAEEDAAQWAKFLGWPIVDLGRAEDFDDAPRG
jgi:hypothetical protein